MKRLNLLMIAGILISSNFAHAENAIAYTYIDGNNNCYEISSTLLNYIPIQKENSSSGEYSGGEAKKIALSETQFAEIEKLIHAILKDKQYLEDNREMGFGTITIGNKAKFIDRNSPLLKNLNAHLTNLLAS